MGFFSVAIWVCYNMIHTLWVWSMLVHQPGTCILLSSINWVWGTPFTFRLMSLSGFVRATLCTTSTVQDYVVHHWPALCTTYLCCAPWCTRGPIDKHFGGAQCSVVLTRWYTRGFCMFIISSDCYGAQYDVVSLAVCQVIWVHHAPGGFFVLVVIKPEIHEI